MHDLDPSRPPHAVVFSTSFKALFPEQRLWTMARANQPRLNFSLSI